MIMIMKSFVIERYNENFLYNGMEDMKMSIALTT